MTANTKMPPNVTTRIAVGARGPSGDGRSTPSAIDWMTADARAV
jgi:hypothetical protein